MFSEKYNYKPEQPIQIETVSDRLRQRIWNLFYSTEIKAGGLGSDRIGKSLNGEPLVEDLLLDKFGADIDQTGKTKYLKELILKDTPWYIIYDFIENHLSVLNEDARAVRTKQYNDLLEQEKSGYRVINGEVAPISNELEINAIENAASTPYDSVNKHIQKALEHYSDRENPDYKNSIKESISAVEAICCIITSTSGKGATLGFAIKRLKENGVYIHPAMESAFNSLYGYTSDEQGIRHGGIDFKEAPAEDAKYMLVSCSAFVNYLIEKWSRIEKR